MAPAVPARVVAPAAVYAGRGGHRIRVFEPRDTALIAIIAVVSVVLEGRGGQSRAIVAVEHRPNGVVRDMYGKFRTCIGPFQR